MHTRIKIFVLRREVQRIKGKREALALAAPRLSSVKSNKVLCREPCAATGRGQQCGTYYSKYRTSRRAPFQSYPTSFSIKEVIWVSMKATN